MPNQTEPPLTTKAAAAWLTEQGYPTTANYLAKRACYGDGPQYRLWSRQRIYTKTDLLTWAENRAGPPITSATERMIARRGVA